MSVYLFLVTLSFSGVTTAIFLHPLSDEFIKLINEKQNSWRAGRNFPEGTPASYIKKLAGALKPDTPRTFHVKQHSPNIIASLPVSFDSRENWPNCPSLREIQDQGSCRSSWALSTVGTITDRICIFSNSTQHVHISAKHILSCGRNNQGCAGGRPSGALADWLYYGIVTGGAYNSSEGCQPYSIQPCDHYIPGKRFPCHNDITPECEYKCVDGYNVSYWHDRHKGKKAFLLIDEDQIKAEIYLNGPVLATFILYHDFLSYKSGVYSHTSGNKLGWQATKVLGWGVENGTKYWLCANSWNEDWGDKGYFKFLRGNNECEFEDDVVSGEPQLSSIK